MNTIAKITIHVTSEISKKHNVYQRVISPPIHHASINCHVTFIFSLPSHMIGTRGYSVANRVPWIFLLCITTQYSTFVSIVVTTMLPNLAVGRRSMDFFPPILLLPLPSRMARILIPRAPSLGPGLVPTFDTCSSAPSVSAIDPTGARPPVYGLTLNQLSTHMLPVPHAL